MKNQRDGDSNSDKRTAAATNLDDIVAFSQTPEGREQTVAHIKQLGGVAAAEELEQVIDGKLTPLADDGHVTIKGHEVFISHVRASAGS